MPFGIHSQLHSRIFHIDATIVVSSVWPRTRPSRGLSEHIDVRRARRGAAGREGCRPGVVERRRREEAIGELQLGEIEFR